MTSPTGAGSPPPISLRRFRERQRPARPPGEVCEMCGETIADEHSHVVNIEQRNLMCACRGCYLLFTNPGAGQGKYRSVPDRYLTDPRFAFTEEQWTQLQVPVDVAFFFSNSISGQTVGFYPSPGGATESELPLSMWSEITAANPLAALPEPDTEALLIRRNGSVFECFLVPIDACYELVGLVRLYWKGFSGGTEVWSAIDEFFGRVRGRSRALGIDGVR